MDEKKEPERCILCGCTEEEGAWGIEEFKGKLVCHQCYYDVESEIEALIMKCLSCHHTSIK